MSGYGPFTATVNTVATVDGLDAGATQVRLVNPSQYDLLVAFVPVKPQPRSVLTAPYDEVVPANNAAVFAVPLDNYYNGQFSGVFYVCPITAAASQNSATSGSQPTPAQFYVSTYLDGQTPAQGGATGTGVVIANQPRIVSVPIAMSHWLTGQAQGNAGGNAVVTINTLTPSAAQLAAGRMPIYYYWGCFTGVISGNQGAEFNLGIQWQTAGGANVGGLFAFMRFAMNTWNSSGQFQNTIIQFFPPFPLVYGGGVGASGNIPATATQAKVQFAQLSGGAVTFDYTLALWADPTNLYPNQDIGVYTLWSGVSPQPIF